MISPLEQATLEPRINEIWARKEAGKITDTDIRDNREFSRVFHIYFSREINYDSFVHTEPNFARCLDYKIIYDAMCALDNGIVRSAAKSDGRWVTNDWVKRAILLYFMFQKNDVMNDENTAYDKVPLKTAEWSHKQFADRGIRLAPNSTVRFGSYLGPGTVIMPGGFVNTGAYVGCGSMVDTGGRVASCAQIGDNTHIGGGSGIAGVLEPVEADPTCVGDNCFIGPLVEIAGGVKLPNGAKVLGPLNLTSALPIMDTYRNRIFYLREDPYGIPEDSLIVPRTLISQDKKTGLYVGQPVARISQLKDSTTEKLQIESMLHGMQKRAEEQSK